MSLRTSPAGVPWSLGVNGLMQEETRIYTERLADEWMRDTARKNVLKVNGLSDEQLRGAMKIAATGVWGFGCDQVQANSNRQGWSIRQVAKMNERGYQWARAFPLSGWKDLVEDVVIPIFKDGKGEGAE